MRTKKVVYFSTRNTVTLTDYQQQAAIHPSHHTPFVFMITLEFSAAVACGWSHGRCSQARNSLSLLNSRTHPDAVHSHTIIYNSDPITASSSCP